MIIKINLLNFIIYPRLIQIINIVEKANILLNIVPFVVKNLNKEMVKEYRTNLSKLIPNIHSRNKVPININESREHLFKKVEICYQLRELGFDFICEANFKSYGRADIFIPEADVVIEILHTEEVLEANKINYPVKRIIIVKTYEDVDLASIL